jgi:hypothetical protein
MSKHLYSVLYDKNKKPRYILPCAAYAKNRAGDTVYFEIVSNAVQPVNAFWANIRCNWRTTQLTPTYIAIYDQDHNKEVLSIVPREKRHYGAKNGHHFMMHEGFDKLHLEYLLGGSPTEPAPMFETALRQYVEAPFLSAWTQTLWEAGINQKLITELSAVGMTGWRLSKIAKGWQELIINLRNQGELQHG